jgi:hypothetical protein
MAFANDWHRFDDLVFGIEQPPSPCPFARHFEAWTGDLLARLTREPTLVAINQTKILLADKYFEWQRTVPKAHRSIGRRTHRCIHHIFAEAYERVKSAELALTPPLLFLPPPPPPPEVPDPPQQIAGVFLGELDE